MICFLSLVSFTFKNPSANWLGMTGYGIGWLFSYLFGVSAYFVLAFAGWVGVEIPPGWKSRKPRYESFLLLCFSFFFFRSSQCPYGKRNAHPWRFKA
ncbi:MAG: hypothetical protein LVR00_07655 [Rhabdochlamydiaceae bacterium]